LAGQTGNVFTRNAGLGHFVQDRRFKVLPAVSASPGLEPFGQRCKKAGFIREEFKFAEGVFQS
jgi:hypothetical protein